MSITLWIEAAPYDSTSIDSASIRSTASIAESISNVRAWSSSIREFRFSFWPYSSPISSVIDSSSEDVLQVSSRKAVQKHVNEEPILLLWDGSLQQFRQSDGSWGIRHFRFLFLMVPYVSRIRCNHIIIFFCDFMTLSRIFFIRNGQAWYFCLWDISQMFSVPLEAL